MAIEAEPKAPGEAEGGATASKAAATPSPAGAQLGGARADFVASLGRKIADVRSLLGALEADLRAKGPRDELRRRLHALGAGARMLRFEAMARQIAEGTTALDHVSKEGKATAADVAGLFRILDDLPALAWADAGETRPAADAAMTGPPAGAPLSILVVGGEAIAEALTEDGESVFFECERAEQPAGGAGLARALAPDLVVIDGDMDGALELVETLSDDPLTEPVPILILGDFRSTEKASRFVALGVAKTLAKPVSPAALQRACQELADQRAEGRTVRVVLGEPTVEQLAERLGEELRRALVDSLDPVNRRARVALGEGTEVLGAVWGAIARVREVITMRTDGDVRYLGNGPEGAVAMASWLQQDVPGLDRGARRGRGAAADVSLDHVVVVVADDDPGVTWFIADLLRGAGCVVHEALDGRHALALAYEHSPQLVISDILMPGLDGFGLCRALKRDVALRDVPVILLSWKEDLLQRVRELGAPAAGYLRKESDARAIVARVREVLRPRARIEARLQGEGEVRGRLDDLSVHSLLELVCALRPSSRISVRDASFLYEIEVRDGSPRRATRTAGDGSFRRGEGVIASMLGVGAGRFVVTPSRAVVAGDLSGALSEQLARPLRLAREAMAATTGTRTANVDRLILDDESVAGYLLATPLPARDVVKKIAEGGSPRAMLVKGEVAPTLLEDVLVDLAARGAILGAQGPLGDNLLDPSVDRDLDPKRPPTFTPTPVAEAVIAEPGPSGSKREASSLEAALLHAMRDKPMSSASDSDAPVPVVDAKRVAAAAIAVASPVVEASPAAPAVAASSVYEAALVAAREVEREERSSPVAAPSAPVSEKSIPVAVETLEPTRSAELSKTAPSREKARRAAAAARVAEPPAVSASPMPREGRGRGVLAMLVVLGVAGALGTYWCSLQASPREPEPSSKTP